MRNSIKGMGFSFLGRFSKKCVLSAILLDIFSNRSIIYRCKNERWAGTLYMCSAKRLRRCIGVRMKGTQDTAPDGGRGKGGEHV